jgi:hypothetical protein
MQNEKVDFPLSGSKKEANRLQFEENQECRYISFYTLATRLITNALEMYDFLKQVI